MSMSMHVVGFRQADDKFNAMKAIWEICEKNKVSIPDEVLEYFDEEHPDIGQTVDLGSTKWEGECGEGLEIDLAFIPDYVKIIRFYVSW